MPWIWNVCLKGEKNDKRAGVLGSERETSVEYEDIFTNTVQ